MSACKTSASGGWADLSQELISHLVDSTGWTPDCSAAMRSACKAWRLKHDATVKALKPSGEAVIDDHLLSLSNTFPAIVAIELEHCFRVTDVGVRSLFEQLPGLQRFRLSDCAKVTGDVLKPTCEKAAAVNKANKERAKNNQPLERCPCELTHLELSHQPRMSVGAVTNLRELTSLRTLILSHCPLTDTGVKDLRRLHGLQHLDLSHCPKLTDKGIASLNKCGKNLMTELTLLNLEGLPLLTDKAFEKMEERMSSLQQLRLHKGVPHPTSAGLAVVVGE